VNAGTYRVCVRDKNIAQHLHRAGQKLFDLVRREMVGARRGEHCPMVVTVGQGRRLAAAALATVPKEVSEIRFAGARLARSSIRSPPWAPSQPLPRQAPAPGRLTTIGQCSPRAQPFLADQVDMACPAR